MDAPDKLPLLLSSFRLLIDSLDPDDTVAIVTYAGSCRHGARADQGIGEGEDPGEPRPAGGGRLDRGRRGHPPGLRSWPSSPFDADGVNRVILATDGDFNVGISDHVDELKRFIEKKRESGVFLSVLGLRPGQLQRRT